MYTLSVYSKHQYMQECVPSSAVNGYVCVCVQYSYCVCMYTLMHRSASGATRSCKSLRESVAPKTHDTEKIIWEHHSPPHIRLTIAEKITIEGIKMLGALNVAQAALWLKLNSIEW